MRFLVCKSPHLKYSVVTGSNNKALDSDIK